MRHSRRYNQTRHVTCREPHSCHFPPSSTKGRAESAAITLRGSPDGATPPHGHILQPLPQTRPGHPRRRNHSVPRFRVTFAFKGLLIPKFGILRRLGGPRTHTPETLKLSPRSQGVECVWEREGVYRVRDIVSSTKNGFSFMQPMNQLILDSAWASD